MDELLQQVVDLLVSASDFLEEHEAITRLEELGQTLGELDEETRQTLLGALAQACDAMTFLVDATEGGQPPLLERALDGLVERFAGAEILIPEERLGEIREKVHEFEARILEQAGLNPEKVSDLIYDIAGSLNDGKPVRFGVAEKNDTLAQVRETRDAICRAHEEARAILNGFTLADVKEIVGGIRDVCVVVVDVGTVVTDGGTISLITAARSVIRSGLRLRDRVQRWLGSPPWRRASEDEDQGGDGDRGEAEDDEGSRGAREAASREQRTARKHTAFRKYLSTLRRRFGPWDPE